jgi:acetylornithine/succinyldiaminopimelate/putrescine aminotransferase
MPIAAERGEGVWIYTSDGDKYLDLYGGHAVAAPAIVIRTSSTHFATGRRAAVLFKPRLLERSCACRREARLDRAAALTKAFFCNSGTEANENAMRMARMATGREQIITFSGGFHGRTADSISATFLGKYRELGKPNVPGHLEAEFGNIDSVRDSRTTRRRDHARADSVDGGVRMAQPISIVRCGRCVTSAASC